MPDADSPSAETATPWKENGRALLVEAWRTYDEYDYNARRLQRRFRRLQRAILFTGVLVVLVVAIQSQRASVLGVPIEDAGTALHWIVIALPLVLSALIT